MTRELRDITNMAVAEIFGGRSTCDRAHVGAVIAREGRILSTGYNGAPAGIDHCVHEPQPSDSAMVRSITSTPSIAGHTAEANVETCWVSVHAEANAIAYAARYGISTDGCDLLTTLSPCMECAKLAINAGVWRVVFRDPYRDTRSLQFLTAAGIQVVKL